MSASKQYRYRPKNNRTPISHPVFGHLEWDQVYDSPECANNPDFEEMKADQPANKPADADEAKPGSKGNPIVVAVDNASGESPANASKPGRR